MGDVEREPLLPSQPQPHGRSKCTGRLSLWVVTALSILGVTSIILWAQKDSFRLGHNGGSSEIQTCQTKFEDENDIPSVGLALSLTHATAAILWPNGISETVGAIRAEDEYVEVMKRLAQSSSRHVRPPYYPFHTGGPGEYLRQLLRSSRKRVGLPATPDVGKLASPLKPLLEQINTRLGCKQIEMTLVTTGIQALYDEDVEDLMQHLGLRQLPLRHYTTRMGCEQPHELASAYAAHGLGMCETYWNATACAQEESAMTFELILSLSYTAKGIALSQAGFKAAYMGVGYDDILSDRLGFEGWGYDYKSEYGSELAYWWSMREMLGNHVFSNLRHNYTRLFILDDVSDEDGRQIQDIMEDILDKWQPGVIQVYRGQSLFTAAIGAARFAQHGRYVTVHESRMSQSDMLKMSPDPMACPWYGYTID